MPTLRRRNSGEWHGSLVKLIAIVVVIFLLVGPGIRCAQQLPEMAGQAAGQVMAGLADAAGNAIGGFFKGLMDKFGDALKGIWDQVKCHIPGLGIACSAEEASATSATSAAVARKPYYECLIQRSMKADQNACAGFQACGPADLRMQDPATPSAWMNCMDNQARASLSRSDVVGAFDGCKSAGAGAKLNDIFITTPKAMGMSACLDARRKLDLARRAMGEKAFTWSGLRLARATAAACAREPDWPRGCGSEPAIVNGDSVRTDKNYTACVWKVVAEEWNKKPDQNFWNCETYRADTQRYVQCMKIKVKLVGRSKDLLACDAVSEY